MAMYPYTGELRLEGLPRHVRLALYHLGKNGGTWGLNRKRPETANRIVIPMGPEYQSEHADPNVYLNTSEFFELIMRGVFQVSTHALVEDIFDAIEVGVVLDTMDTQDKPVVGEPTLRRGLTMTHHIDGRTDITDQDGEVLWTGEGDIPDHYFV